MTDETEIRAVIGSANRGRELAGRVRVAEIEAPLRDPDIARALASGAERVAALRDRISEFEARGGKADERNAARMRVELRKVLEAMEAARKLELRRDAIMGEARDALIRAKLRGELVSVRETETAEIVTDEHGARVINRRGPMRGLPAMRYGVGAEVRKLSGLAHAYAAGHLGHPKTGRGADALYEAGNAYWSNAAISEPLKAVDPSQVGGHGNGPRGPQEAAISASAWLSIARDGLQSRDRQILDLVCIDGHTLYGAAQKADKSIDATRTALRRGLMRVIENHRRHREAVQAGEVVSVRSKMKAGRRVMAGV